MSEDPLARVAGLAEPVRRRLYRFVGSRPGGVGRDQAAEAEELSRSTASYHLDKLVEDGFLQVRYERLTGRSGPGAGRPAKIYERVDRAIEVSVPRRDYETVAALLATAIERDGADVHRALIDVAHEYGRDLWKRRSLTEEPADVPCAAIMPLLLASGYEPYEHDGHLELRNCPFNGVARTHRDLVCAMNLAIVQGIITASAERDLTASIAADDSRCCVVIVCGRPVRTSKLPPEHRPPTAKRRAGGVRERARGQS